MKHVGDEQRIEDVLTEYLNGSISTHRPFLATNTISRVKCEAQTSCAQMSCRFFFVFFFENGLSEALIH